jgi:hypothetical protein
MSRFYGESAEPNMKQDDDAYNLIMQFAIYQIHNGDFGSAINNIEIAKNIKGQDGCPLCDQLEKIMKDTQQ